MSVSDRLLPYSHEAEQGVLGCCLLDARAALPEAQSQIGSSEAFYDLRHRIVWEVIVAMEAAGEVIDTITVRQRLKDQNQLESVGGDTSIAAMVDGVPVAASVNYYVEKLVQKWQLRKLVQVCTHLVSEIYDGPTDSSDEIIDRAERDVLSVRKIKAVGLDILSARSLVQQAIDVIETHLKSAGVLSGLATGFVDLDKMTDGLQPGEMTVIAALPSVGKTSWALNVAEHVAIDQQQPVGIFSVEMTARSLMTRLLCSRARVNTRHLRDGFLAERDFPKLTAVARKIAAANIHFVEQSDLSIGQCRALARRMVQQHGIKLFIVDYLQLLTASGRFLENKTQETAAISGGLKKMAKELDVHVIAASQLTKDRDGSTRCRNAAEIAQDADNLFELTRKKMENEDGSTNTVRLDVRKQRNGPTGAVNLVFLPAWTRFESASKIDDDTSSARAPYAD